MAFLIPVAYYLGCAIIGGVVTGKLVSDSKDSTIKEVKQREQNERAIRRAL